MRRKLSVAWILLALGLAWTLPIHWRALSRGKINLPEPALAPAGAARLQGQRVTLQLLRYDFVVTGSDGKFGCDNVVIERSFPPETPPTIPPLNYGCKGETLTGQMELSPLPLPAQVSGTIASNGDLVLDTPFSLAGKATATYFHGNRVGSLDQGTLSFSISPLECLEVVDRKSISLEPQQYSATSTCQVKTVPFFSERYFLGASMHFRGGNTLVNYGFVGIYALPAAQISLNPTTLNFKTSVLGNNPAQQTVTLKNNGSSTLNWQAQASVDGNSDNWLSVTPASGSLAANQSTTLTVRAERKKVGPPQAGGEPGPILAGDYTGSIKVSASGASNSPQSVGVKFTLDCPGGNTQVSSSAAGPAQQQCTNVVTLDPDSAAPLNNSEVIRLQLETTGISVPVVYYLIPPNTPAGLVLRVFDQDGKQRGSSAVFPITKSGASPDPVPMTIQGKDLSLDPINGVEIKTLTVKALLIDAAEKVIKESGNTVKYTVKSDSLFFIGDSLKINGQAAPDGSNFPSDGKINKPGFTCQLGYELLNAPSGEIRLMAVNPASGALLSATQHIAVTSQPETKVGMLSFEVPLAVPTIQIVAELFDDKQPPRKLKSAMVSYSRPKLRIELGIYFMGDFAPFDSPLLLDSGAGIKQALPINILPTVRVTYDLAAPSGKLRLFLTERMNNGTIKRGPELLAENNQVPGGVQKQILLPVPDRTVPDDVDQWVLTVSLLSADDKQLGLSDPILLPITRVRLVDYAPKVDKLTQGDTIVFNYTLEYNVIRAGANRLRPVVAAMLKNRIVELDTAPIFIADLGPGESSLNRQGEILFQVPPDAEDIAVGFVLENSGFPGKVAFTRGKVNYGTNAKEPITETQGDFPGGKASNVKNPTSLRPIPSRVEKGFKNILKELQGLPPNQTNLSAKQALLVSLNQRDLLSINAYWQFDPPIPRDRGFSADLTFNYAARLLPDDPNFNEAKLQVISYDPATGSLESYPTTLDTTNKTATAHVNWLAAFYTVGVVGPFTQQTLNSPFFSTGSDLATRLIMLNTGINSATLKLNSYAATGETLSGSGVNNPVSTSLPAAQQLSRLAAELFNFGANLTQGWVQTRVDKTLVAGYQLIGSGNKTDGLDLPSFYSVSPLLTDIEYDATYTTQIQLANVTNFESNVRLELHAASGTQVGTTYETTLQPKEKFSRFIQEIFPNLARPFSGYLLVNGDNDLAVAELLVSNAELAALNGQLPPNASNSAARLYAPYFAHDSRAITTTLNLVNPTARAANLTLRAVNATGANLASPVTVALAAGQQYRRAAGQIFNLTANLLTEGSLVIEGNITGIVGDVSYSDPTNAQAFRASLPLASEPTRLAAFAHLDNRADSFTQLSIFNPNAQSASVEVKVQRATGSVAGSAKVSVPAGSSFNKRLSEVVPAAAGQQGGYFTLNADQPITATAVFGTLARTVLSALRAQPFTKQCLEVTLPANLSGNRGSALTVPLNVTDTTGADAISFDAVITYDPTVLRLQNPPTDKTNTLSNGMTITANSPTAGRLNISAFGTMALSGAGALLNLKFDVIGAAAACSALTVTSFRFNEDSPCVTTTNGRVCVADPNANNAVALPQLTAANGSSLTIPITVGDLTGRGFIAYDFDLSFDQTVLQLQSPSFDAAGTLSNGMTITTNPTAGRLRLSAFGTTPLAGSGTLLRLKFNVVGAGGTSTNLTWQRFVFNETPQTNPTPGRVNVVNAVASVSAASFTGQQLAPESIVAAFGVGLATSVVSANEVPLPTTLAGTTVRVRDSAGTERLAPLFFVAPAQINYLLPLGTALGTATITVTSGNGTLSAGTLQIAQVAPGLFAANASGQGLPAAVLLRVKADNSQSIELVAQFEAATGSFTPVPIELGPEGEQVFLILFGTGFHAVSSLANVTARIGGVNAEVLFAGAQGLAGLDQANVRVPRSLVGRGQVDVVLTVEGKAANTLRVTIR